MIVSGLIMLYSVILDCIPRKRKYNMLTLTVYCTYTNTTWRRNAVNFTQQSPCYFSNGSIVTVGRLGLYTKSLVCCVLHRPCQRNVTCQYMNWDRFALNTTTLATTECLVLDKDHLMVSHSHFGKTEVTLLFVWSQPCTYSTHGKNVNDLKTWFG